MSQTFTPPNRPTPLSAEGVDKPNKESNVSGIHWSSILGGAAAAMAISLIMLPLGAALGFSSFSVFTATAGTAIVMTSGWAIWLVVMQWLSSLCGGYIAGRLRVKWADTHSDEVFFRDTAHGFIAWAVATILTVVIIAGVTLSGINAAVKSAAPAVISDNETSGPYLTYYVDGLYRPLTPQTASAGDVKAETALILSKGLREGEISADDGNYLASLIAARTGLTQPQALMRVQSTLKRIEADRTKTAETAETARKAAARASLILFLSLLIGAFISSAAAALAGRLRDEVSGPTTEMPDADQALGPIA